jgi:hypothetical protein
MCFSLLTVTLLVVGDAVWQTPRRQAVKPLELPFRMLETTGANFGPPGEMRRAVENHLEDALAEEFLRGNIKPGDTLEVHAAGEQLAFKVTQPEQGEPANGNPLRSRGL